MTTEAFGSVPHGSPPATTAGGGGASSYAGQSDPDMLLEGLKHIRKRKEKRAAEKLAIRVRTVHGTSGSFKELVGGVGKTILKNDPNPRALYMATKRRSTKRSIEGFARAAATARGGTPTVAHAKIDTKKGWSPHALTVRGKKDIGGMDDALDLIDELDHGNLTGKARGAAWKKLQQGIGAWKSPAHDTKLKVLKNRPV